MQRSGWLVADVQGWKVGYELPFSWRGSLRCRTALALAPGSPVSVSTAPLCSTTTTALAGVSWSSSPSPSIASAAPICASSSATAPVSDLSALYPHCSHPPSQVSLRVSMDTCLVVSQWLQSLDSNGCSCIFHLSSGDFGACGVSDLNSSSDFCSSLFLRLLHCFCKVAAIAVAPVLCWACSWSLTGSSAYLHLNLNRIFDRFWAASFVCCVRPEHLIDR